MPGFSSDAQAVWAWVTHGLTSLQLHASPGTTSTVHGLSSAAATTSTALNATHAANIAQNRTSSAGAASAAEAARQAAWQAAGAKGITYDANNGPGGGNPEPTKPIIYTGVVLASTDLDYNVGMVLSAYHNSRFTKETGQQSDLPKNITGSELTNQFSSPGQNKGMIVTFVPSDPANNAGILPSKDGASAVEVEGRYGFQFHYNPAKFAITYSGQPKVDLGFEAANLDPFHPAGSALSQSSISINIPINRIADFAYYDPTTKHLKAGVSPAIYGGKHPTTADQERIWEYGTMYDVEWLLAATLGYKMKTKYRDVTSDLGYVSGRLVEVILGKRLHYVGMVTSVTVNHEIFDQRMVPIWSTLDITFTIVPDFESL